MYEGCENAALFLEEFMELSRIPAEHFADYRTDVMFDGYKWDLQAGEQSTISDCVLLMEPSEADYYYLQVWQWLILFLCFY